ncbi:MAG: tetratricopeptide repeat protein [Oscillatoriales cyanobacterium RM1_1_9]|nr:tetratricopeptide repeat protein [Oscillatoriales cyanobacterium SM2_3_0]NJO46132.1 tetratricopeptide repeat protein [Oscillatoriales cyanobacterium RM2_1_1]NJO72260.1 tetratricopeptide repeat protein [Oscillatoriales cyanobacterium RM1_1_9]
MLRRISEFLVLISLLVLWGFPALAVASSELVFPDYQQRSQIIHAYELQVQQSPDSYLLLRLLAEQYLRRFREGMDQLDLRRAEQAARQSLAIQPNQNRVSTLILASTLLSQHRFQKALQVVKAAEASASNQTDLVALEASIQMELGDYEAVQDSLQTLSQQTLSQQTLTEDFGHSGHAAITARYLELTGHLDEARQLLDKALAEVDQFYTTPAEVAAWFHLRAGDLAFKAGDLELAEQRYHEALERFPQARGALTGLAGLYGGQHRWSEALDIANQVTQQPSVKILGYKAEAQRALGDQTGAAATEVLMASVADQSFNGTANRALAAYYVDHGIHLPEALKIAQGEVSLRDDVYTEDALAWAAATNGQWQLAQQAATKAARYGTEDALLYFHRGMIALHCDNPDEALQWLRQAIRLNPQFHPHYADVARQVLADLDVGA